MKIKKNIANKILNSFIVLLFTVSIFSYTSKNNTEAFNLTAFLTGGYENAGGYVVIVTKCTCGNFTAFKSKGPNGGDYIDSFTTTHYERGKVGYNTLTHISKTTFPIKCQVVVPHKGCQKNPIISSGRLLLFGGTAKRI